jgi:hypothetical protein
VSQNYLWTYFHTIFTGRARDHFLEREQVCGINVWLVIHGVASVRCDNFDVTVKNNWIRTLNLELNYVIGRACAHTIKRGEFDINRVFLNACIDALQWQLLLPTVTMTEESINYVGQILNSCKGGTGWGF